jgi:hypothetical protein
VGGSKRPMHALAKYGPDHRTLGISLSRPMTYTNRESYCDSAPIQPPARPMFISLPDRWRRFLTSAVRAHSLS